jgi:pimeloyl-ACP methyl ester carboxylesterase
MADTSSASVTPPETDAELELTDGRTLGYAAYGPADGDPLLYFHGTPGSRYTRVPETSLLEAHGVRQVTLERPGFGRSTYDPDRTLLDWPDDVREAADILGYEQFAIAGHSGGGPHTLACAHSIPDRVTSVGVISGMGPLDAPKATQGMEFKTRLGFTLARVPFALRPFLWLRTRKLRNDPDGFLDVWADSSAEADRETLQRPAVRAVIIQGMQEALKNGTKPPLHENRLFAQSWGFDLADISTPVDLWYGEQDTFTPEAMARHVVDAIPESNPTFYADEGHLLYFNRWDEILSTLNRE